ncbi:phage terminase large subunit [bacterium]|nr:phage terminase large subunit [bacterium]
MQYKLLNAQRKFMEIPHKYSLDVAVYQGGFGSGKTFCGSLLGVLLCLKYPQIKGLVGAQTYPLVRDTTLSAYFEHLNALGFDEGKDWGFSKSERLLRFKNGSEVMFRHFDEPDKLKSLNLGFAQIEEMSDVPKSVFNMLLGRLRQSIQPCWHNFQYRLFGHTNPEERKGWIYDTFARNPPPNYRLIIAPTTENIFLPKGFVDELRKSYDEDYFTQNVLGQWLDSDDSLVVKGFSDSNVRNLDYDEHLDLHLSCDFNVDPMSWVVAHKTESKVFFIDEIVLENTTTARAMDEFLTRYPRHKGRIVINGDASGDNRSCTSEFTNYSLMLRKLALHGYSNVDVEIRPFNPPIKNRVIAFNTLIRSADGELRIFIDPKCEKLIYNLKNLKYRSGSSQIDIPTYHQIRKNRELKFLSHPFDAASYLVEFYFPLAI